MNLALALTFLEAPFLHVHKDEITEHHHGGFFHAHFHHHHLEHPTLPEFHGIDPDDDAVDQQWFSATIINSSAPVFLLSVIYCYAPGCISEPSFQADILSGHDPPRRSRSAPRSPPA
jgi:hypothetical protein